MDNAAFQRENDQHKLSDFENGSKGHVEPRHQLCCTTQEPSYSSCFTVMDSSVQHSTRDTSTPLSYAVIRKRNIKKTKRADFLVALR